MSQTDVAYGVTFSASQCFAFVFCSIEEMFIFPSAVVKVNDVVQAWQMVLMQHQLLITLASE